MYSEWKGLKDTEKSSFDKMAKNDEKRYSLVEKQDSLITYTEKAGLFLFPQGMELLESDVEKTDIRSRKVFRFLDRIRFFNSLQRKKTD